MYAKYLYNTLKSVIEMRSDSPRVIKALPELLDAYEYVRKYSESHEFGEPEPGAPNPLREYFDGHKEGRGIWKWLHYFDVYHRHLQKFVGREVHLMEVGIYSGGSLDMWQHYFGGECMIYGVDIEDACRCYETDKVKVLIGDQADRGFWKSAREEVPKLDVLIDDGGHTPEQQLTTLQEVLPHLRPGGVLICEDVLGIYNPFSAFVAGLNNNLNVADTQEDATINASSFQRSISSIHHYPFITVIEKAHQPVEKFEGPKHGTEWQPFEF